MYCIWDVLIVCRLNVIYCLHIEKAKGIMLVGISIKSFTTSFRSYMYIYCSAKPNGKDTMSFSSVTSPETLLNGYSVNNNVT